MRVRDRGICGRSTKIGWDPNDPPSHYLNLSRPHTSQTGERKWLKAVVVGDPTTSMPMRPPGCHSGQLITITWTSHIKIDRFLPVLKMNRIACLPLNSCLGRTF